MKIEELAIRGKPRYENEKDWPLEVSPDMKMKRLAVRGKPRYENEKTGR